MMIVRHAEFRDLEDIYKLAGKSGVGLTSLPQNMDTLSARISRTRNTLNGNVHKVNKAIYLFLKIQKLNVLLG